MQHHDEEVAQGRELGQDQCFEGVAELGEHHRKVAIVDYESIG